MNRDFPLGLPPGSVRALLAIAIVAVWGALELGSGAPDAVRALAAAVAAAYGLMRSRSESDLSRAATPYQGEHDAR